LVDDFIRSLEAAGTEVQPVITGCIPHHPIRKAPLHSG